MAATLAEGSRLADVKACVATTIVVLSCQPMVEVTVLPNRFRPGVGLAPSRVAQRPWLPQHARLCPVLEAGSALGYLVYPPLRPDEAFQILYQDTKYQVTFFRERKPGQWDDVFRLTFSLAVGGGSSYSADLAVKEGGAPPTDAEVNELCTAVILPQHFGQPPGAVGLRGSADFRTPSGWDTVYGAVVNQISPPVLSCLTVRIETDWYSQGTEFRYVLQPGDLLHVTATQPIGQVLFVPRDEVTLRDGSKEDAAEFFRQRDTFDEEKAADQVTAPYGLRYSPLYQKRRQGKTRRPDDKTEK
jgi:hypothetical protein